jgi:hypothetical protein
LAKLCIGFSGREETKERRLPIAPAVVVIRHRLVCVNRTSELAGCIPHSKFPSEDLNRLRNAKEFN